MNNPIAEKDSIQLSLPMNAAYVSAARLTASSVANRMGFSTDEIEDIKAAVSEACTFIINKAAPDSAGNFLLQFLMSSGTLSVSIRTDGILSQEAEEMSLIMIKALMDRFDFKTDNNETVLYMAKGHNESLF